MTRLASAAIVALACAPPGRSSSPPVTRREISGLLLCALLATGLAPRGMAQPAPSVATEPLPELETFVVTGEQPGPALWKVTRREHTLWILPTFGPLPDQLEWQSAQVEEVIRHSQQVFALSRIPVERPTDAKSQQRLWKAVTNPDGKRLRDVMPPDLYRQFSELNRRYAGNSNFFELFRPYQATDMLKDSAMARLSLTSEGGVHDTVLRLARQYGVEFMTFENTDTHAWDKLVSQLEKTPREADLACTKVRLDRLESDLREAINRSNAWARGDIAALRKDPGLHADAADLDVCRQFFQHMRYVRQALASRRKNSHAAYLQALKKNQSTLILVPIDEMFDPNGLIAGFRKAGYQVEEP